jgi:hypothetical protein
MQVVEKAGRRRLNSKIITTKDTKSHEGVHKNEVPRDTSCPLRLMGFVCSSELIQYLSRRWLVGADYNSADWARCFET